MFKHNLNAENSELINQKIATILKSSLPKWESAWSDANHEDEWGITDDIETPLPAIPNGVTVLFGYNNAACRHFEPFRHERNKAIEMPMPGQFKSLPDFYQTLFHELIHAIDCKFGERNVMPIEELTAEIGAVYLCYCADFLDKMLINSISYIDFFLKQITHNGDTKNTMKHVSSKALNAAQLIVVGAKQSPAMKGVAKWKSK